MPALPANIEKMKMVRGYAVGPNDVFCGHRMNWSGGNKRLGELVSKNLERYNRAALDDKSAIAAELLGHIVKNGGRFLKEENKKVVTLTPKEAKTKIMQKFRDTKKALNAAPKPVDAKGKPIRKPYTKRKQLPPPPASLQPALKRPAITPPGSGENPYMLGMKKRPSTAATSRRFCLPLASKKRSSLPVTPGSSSSSGAAAKVAASDEEDTDDEKSQYNGGRRASSSSQEEDDDSASETSADPYNPVPEAVEEEAGDQFEDATESEETDQAAQAMQRPVVMPDYNRRTKSFEEQRMERVKAIQEAAAAAESKPPVTLSTLSALAGEQPRLPQRPIIAGQPRQRPEDTEQDAAVAAIKAELAAAKNKPSNLPGGMLPDKQRVLAAAAAAAGMDPSGNAAMKASMDAYQASFTMGAAQAMFGMATNPFACMQQQQLMIAHHQRQLEDQKTKIELLTTALTRRELEIERWQRDNRTLTEIGAIKQREAQKLEAALRLVTDFTGFKVEEENGEFFFFNGGHKVNASDWRNHEHNHLDAKNLMVLQGQVDRLTKAAKAKDNEIFRLRRELSGGQYSAAEGGMDTEDQELDSAARRRKSDSSSSSAAKDREIAKLRQVVSITQDQRKNLEGAEALKDLTIQKLREELAIKDKQLEILDGDKKKPAQKRNETQTVDEQQQHKQQQQSNDTPPDSSEQPTEQENMEPEEEEEPMYI